MDRENELKSLKRSLTGNSEDAQRMKFDSKPKFSNKAEGFDDSDDSLSKSASSDSDDNNVNDREDDVKEKGNNKKKFTVEIDPEDERDVTAHLSTNDLGTNDNEEVIGIESFNLNGDEEEGHYDDDGFFVFERKHDDDDVPDAFIEGLTGSKYALAAVPASKAEASEQFDNMNMYLLRLLEYMKPQETVLQALKRTEKKTQQPQKAHKKPKFAFMEEEQVEDTSDPVAYKCLCESADKAILDHPNIYSNTYEQIKQFITIDKKVLAKKWEYYWKEDPTKIYGPYSTNQMIQWMLEGCFKYNPMIRQYSLAKPKPAPKTEVDEMLNDFDDEQEEDPNPWIPADQIDFYK